MRVNILKEKFYFLLALSISIIFSFIFFLSRDLFSQNEYLFIDHGFNLGFFEFFGEYIALKYFSSYGPSHFLYSGSIYFPLYPMGAICVFIIHLLGFSYSTSYKIHLFLSLLFVGTSPYYISRRLGLKEWSAVFSVIWYWMGMESFFLIMFSTGTIQNHIAVCLAVFFLINIYIPENNKHEQEYSIKYILKNSMLLFFSVMFNYMVGFFILIFVVSRIIFDVVQKRKITHELIEFIVYLSVITIIALLLFSFWLFPTILIHLPYGKFPDNYFLFSQDFALGVNYWYIMKNITSVIVSILILILIKKHFYKMHHRSYNIIKDMFIVSFIMLFLLVYTNFFAFTGVNGFRNLAFLEVTISIILAFGFEYLSTYLFLKKRILRAIKQNLVIPKTSKRTIVVLCLMAVSIIDIIPNSLNKSSFLNPLMYDAKKATGWEEDEVQLMDWIESNTNLSSRILYELSGDMSKFRMSGGHNILYFAMKTNRFYSVGFSHPFIHNYHDQSNYMEGILFEKNISEYTYGELYSYSILYNFKYIICWSNISIAKFLDFTLEQGNFSLITTIQDYYIFEIINSTNNYVISSASGNITEFLYSQDEIKFVFEQSVSQDEKTNDLIISLHDYPNWVVYINGSREPKVKNTHGLIQISLSRYNSIRFNILIKWELTNVELISNFTSIASIVFVILVYRKPKKIMSALSLFIEKIGEVI